MTISFVLSLSVFFSGPNYLLSKWFFCSRLQPLWLRFSAVYLFVCFFLPSIHFNSYFLNCNKCTTITYLTGGYSNYLNLLSICNQICFFFLCFCCCFCFVSLSAAVAAASYKNVLNSTPLIFSVIINNPN